jgi:hypothetical protein
MRELWSECGVVKRGARKRGEQNKSKPLTRLLCSCLPKRKEKKEKTPFSPMTTLSSRQIRRSGLVDGQGGN